jgi:long-chain acyl-CoA synthetase
MTEGQKIPYDLVLGRIFFDRAAALGSKPFLTIHHLRSNADRRAEVVSWKDFAEKVKRAMLGLDSLGLHKGDRVAIMSENRLEWLVADIAVVAAGFGHVLMQANYSDRMLTKALKHSGSRLMFVEDAALAKRIASLKPELPALEKIVIFDASGKSGVDVTTGVDVMTFAELLQRGASGNDGRVRELLDAVHRHDLASILYTSGTTGEPKGVVRTNGNLVLNWVHRDESLPQAEPDECVGVVLSLAHQLGRTHFHRAIICGRSIVMTDLAEPDITIDTLALMKPERLVVVPRFLVRMWSAFLEDESARRAYDDLDALEKKREAGTSLSAEESSKLEALRDEVRSKFIGRMGGALSQIHYAAAPMPPALLRVCTQLKIPLITGYGSTEGGGITFTDPTQPPGRGGKPDFGTEIKLAPDGEILVRGHAVMPGYFNDPVATKEAFDENGFFRTGDMGTFDEEGNLRLVGRKKDIFNCADGSNVYPAWIEAALENDPYIRQAALVGDRRPFIAAFVVPDKAKIAAKLGKSESDLTASEIEGLLRSQVQTMNARVESYEQVREIVVLAEDLPETIRQGVGNVGKVKINRKALEEQFAPQIAALYQKK